MWAVIEVWSIQDAYKLLQAAEANISSQLLPLEDIGASEMAIDQSECWFSVPQFWLYWTTERISVSAAASAKPHLSMHALSFGIACARFMDWISPLERVLANEECMAWVKQNYGLDLVDFCFSDEINCVPVDQAARVAAGLPDNFEMRFI